MDYVTKIYLSLVVSYMQGALHIFFLILITTLQSR